MKCSLRFALRGTEDEDSITLRMENAREEIEWLSQPGNADYTIVNDDLERAYAELKSKVLEWYPHVGQD